MIFAGNWRAIATASLGATIAAIPSCNYADNKEVGRWLENILKKGGTEDWRKVLKEATGEDISTRAMLEYFKPLMSWLEQQNKGRQISWD
jgi:peptidyl-dipeptidase A